MNIRLFDRFDKNFTSAKYTDVDWVDDNIIIFKDGTEQSFDSEFLDWEEDTE